MSRIDSPIRLSVDDDDLVKLIEAIGVLKPRVAAFTVLGLVVVAVLVIATR